VASGRQTLEALCEGHSPAHRSIVACAAGSSSLVGYKAAIASCNRLGSHRLSSMLRWVFVAGVALSASACSLTMQLASFNDEPETTASIPARPSMATKLDASLDDEDWRRAQSALSLAVDPQGPGLPVNWDNPASKRKGSFVAAGNMMIVQDTICRPFAATLVQPTGKEAKHAGQACRLGPGEWALRMDTPTPPAGKDILNQPLPGKTTSTLTALENND